MKDSPKYKTIAIEPDVHQQLIYLSVNRQTFNDVIKKLIDCYVRVHHIKPGGSDGKDND